jgi:hypothetical protein
MTIRFISTASTVAMVLALVSLTVPPVAGQATNTAPKSDLPRMPDGHPDLQGTYDLATMTPLERWPGDPASLTKEEAKALEREPSAGPKIAARPALLEVETRRWAAAQAHRNRSLKL